MCKMMWMLEIAFLGLVLGCGSSGETEADRIGVGAECSDAAECESADEDVTLECLTQFTGGYCGLEGCEGDADCPEGSGCVAHEDGAASGNYCFRLCEGGEKDECNRNRSTEHPSNCSSNVDFVDGKQDRKACVPPSSGLET